MIMLIIMEDTQCHYSLLNLVDVTRLIVYGNRQVLYDYCKSGRRQFEQLAGEAIIISSLMQFYRSGIVLIWLRVCMWEIYDGKFKPVAIILHWWIITYLLQFNEGMCNKSIACRPCVLFSFSLPAGKLSPAMQFEDDPASMQSGITIVL